MGRRKGTVFGLRRHRARRSLTTQRRQPAVVQDSSALVHFGHVTMANPPRTTVVITAASRWASAVNHRTWRKTTDTSGTVCGPLWHCTVAKRGCPHGDTATVLRNLPLRVKRNPLWKQRQQSQRHQKDVCNAVSASVDHPRKRSNRPQNGLLHHHHHRAPTTPHQ